MQGMGYGQPQPADTRPQPIYAPQQPLYSQPQAMPAAAPRANRAEDALRQRSEYGDLWSSNSQDPLAYLDGSESAPQNNSQNNIRSPGAIPAGYYPEFPEAGPLPGQPLPPVHQPPAHQPPAIAPVLPTAYPQPSPYDGFGAAQQSVHAPVGQPWPEASQAQRSTERGIPDDFLARLAVPAARPASPTPMPMPVSAPAPTPAAILPAVPSLAANKTIPANFDPFTSLGFTARKAEPAPAAAPPRTEMPPMPPRLDPPMPVLPSADAAPAAIQAIPAIQPIEKLREAEPLSPALMADVIKIEAPVVLPERRTTQTDNANFDPLEALRSRREERTAALERKAKVQAAIPVNGVAAPVAKPAPAQPIEIPALPATAPLPVPQAVGRDAVIAALFRGMGFPANAPLPAEGEKVAESVGLMVREIAEGLVQLLSARQMLKSEFRMDETQMRPEENNPFKYYKIAELALDELFVTKSGGFQDPAEAAASAFADIQQYVMLTTSAIQRAMTLMFQRLSPEAIAREAEGDGGLRIRGLGGGKGKWETYVDNHARMSGRLDGLTRQIISEAFAQVQEEQARKAASEYWEKKK
jgi:predicted component of type VI protein secretion system